MKLKEHLKIFFFVVPPILTIVIILGLLMFLLQDSPKASFINTDFVLTFLAIATVYTIFPILLAYLLICYLFVSQTDEISLDVWKFTFFIVFSLELFLLTRGMFFYPTTAFFTIISLIIYALLGYMFVTKANHMTKQAWKITVSITTLLEFLIFVSGLLLKTNYVLF